MHDLDTDWTDLKTSSQTLNYDFLNMIERILMVKGMDDVRDHHLFKTVLASFQRFLSFLERRLSIKLFNVTVLFTIYFLNFFVSLY